jgi:hypothetical protein
MVRARCARAAVVVRPSRLGALCASSPLGDPVQSRQTKDALLGLVFVGNVVVGLWRVALGHSVSTCVLLLCCDMVLTDKHSPFAFVCA